jgi:hypothetical protein
MKQYLLLFRGGDTGMAKHSPEEMQTHMQHWMKWMGDLSENGSLLSAQPLDKTGRQVAGTSKIVTDGPYMEGKELVGGYLMCKASDYSEAVEISKGCPILEFPDGNVEIREIKELAM